MAPGTADTAPAPEAAAETAEQSPPTGSGYRVRAERIPIIDPQPRLEDDRWPAKAFVGEVVPFAATAFREGHDLIGVDLLLTSPAGTESEHRMALIATGTDRYGRLVLLDDEGDWTYRIRAFADDWATWLHTAEVKIPAGLDIAVTFAIGESLLRTAAGDDSRSEAERSLLSDAAATVADESLSPEARLAAAEDPAVHGAFTARPVMSLASVSEPRTVHVERTRAGVGAWYEFFPRSEGAVRNEDGTVTSGSFRTAIDRLPAVAAMGFDVLYLPPIHPIGRNFRKGPNNTLNAGPGDPGSPWAIGAPEGGHDAIHPDLGTVEDFTAFHDAVTAAGLELALDFALQASPDHPWVTSHPEWFTTLPDGSIAYAENPPKKYQDIYPINFDNDPQGIRQEALRVLRYWISLGVKIFRVDNPHTKPLDFWEWIIHEVNAENPEVVFLAEAFTRPAIMRALGKVGFQQSYSYFTWRNTKEELEEFFTSISHETADYMRPNLFVNTPDILTEYLQYGGRSAYKVRAALAATASPLWGVYAGYELIENVARPGAEENIDNEKFEYKTRDWAAADAAGTTIAPYITRLNEIRRAHPALAQRRNLQVHGSDDDAILVYSKHLDRAFTGTGSDDTLLVVVNTDPHSARETTVHIDLPALGLDWSATYEVEDLITGAVWTWGSDNYVRLDSFVEPVHILSVKADGR
ncbi:alpha-1,4-glucan--maltose-1-phosphate maltosyltransferase [Rathayibacter sp. VKM Ac-2926]|uniref:alpha-1,4-glucan--maltose-1-phosphate maltosyltransferase n=1 Tax=Rathayibacter sp. VKM Ac-2926 TaxID=2929477 RepID=UPI0027E0D84C|nr:alpha-1,4-glucan--maltose-1-phosphate maltosyltransferase [Rathayibacter sp. VKM Ac-2926]